LERVVESPAAAAAAAAGCLASGCGRGVRGCWSVLAIGGGMLVLSHLCLTIR